MTVFLQPALPEIAKAQSAASDPAGNVPVDTHVSAARRPATARDAFVEDLKAAYSGDMAVLNRIADHADHALLALGAYGEPKDMEAARARGWLPFKSFAIDNFPVGDTVAVLFLGPHDRAVLAFRGTKNSG